MKCNKCNTVRGVCKLLSCTSIFTIMETKTSCRYILIFHNIDTKQQCNNSEPRLNGEITYPTFLKVRGGCAHAFYFVFMLSITTIITTIVGTKLLRFCTHLFLRFNNWNCVILIAWVQERWKMAIKREGERKVIRNKFIKIRVTPAEQERFRQLASERGITLSKLVTDLLEEQHKWTHLKVKDPFAGWRGGVSQHWRTRWGSVC